ncbi:sulfatase-like hydrolase/transferase [Cylindrospermopsis raciborskii]|uniref:sulfatase-like hydrolase/transferase n=1 Tax=Cylindrospermopsis raciborskii TaxID=77022 RepID=UPI003A8FD38A
MGATDFPAKERPNIVFILADDLGWGDLSIDGQKNYQTPYLDQLARDGIRFNQAYSDSPVCTPTRIGFFTGRYPGRLAIGNYSNFHVVKLQNKISYNKGNKLK